MQIISFTTEWSSREPRPRAGTLLNNDYLLDFEAANDGPAPAGGHLAWLDMDGPLFQKSRRMHESLTANPNLLPEAIEKRWLVRRKDAYWFAPVPRPGKLICIGLNYRDHAAESNMPIPER